MLQIAVCQVTITTGESRRTVVLTMRKGFLLEDHATPPNVLISSRGARARNGGPQVGEIYLARFTTDGATSCEQSVRYEGFAPAFGRHVFCY
jgi:hypothetical protein